MSEKTISYVPVGVPFDNLPPEVGQAILIGNAGGEHTGPGSYGWTQTEVLDVEHQEGGTGLALQRLRTDAFGWGCWSTKTTVRVVRKSD